MSLICIDAGHGGHDPGAVNHNVGVTEKSLTLKIAALLGAALASVGHDVFFTRELDVFVPLGTRCKVANEAGADLFISVHINAAADGKARGIETWHCTGSVRGAALASAIHSRVRGSYATIDRGVKNTSGFYVLHHTKAPAVLCELGFITNDSDVVALCSADVQRELARRISLGVEDYLDQKS